MSGFLLALLALADFDRDVAPVLRARCTGCHGAAAQQGGVRLDSREAAQRIAPRVVEMIAARKMPPAGPALKDSEIAVIRQWAATSRPRHWAFEPVRQPAAMPASLAEDGAPMARDRLTRRLYLDLVGLPPPAEPQAEPPNVLIDKLLESPHFGEKWARHWLDLAHYADSDGYEQDQFRPHAWRYRDWVIRAFNRNQPFDQFTRDQIAGDLLPNASLEQRTATGFHRNTLTSREGGIDVEELRTQQAAERASTVATVWLGLTFECAKCHDHKYDPITQRDFYSLYAFFNSVDEVNLDSPAEGELARFRQTRPEYDRLYAELLKQYRVAEFQPRWEAEAMRAMANPSERLEWTQVLDYIAVFQDRGHDILRTPPGQRTPRQTHDITRVFLKDSGPAAGWPEAKGIKFSEGYQKLEELDARFPGMSEVPAIAQRAEPRKTHVFQRGDFRSPGDEVQPAAPSFRPGRARNRFELAQWLTSRDHPLTARVFVNRIWQEMTGRGFVATSEDFGARGDEPSDRAALDWLAADFMDNGWNVKRLIRTIARSRGYRESPRFRLSAEAIRDSALAVSGLLDPRVYGRSVRPPMPKGVIAVAYRNRAWEESQGADRNRRGLYTFFWRSVPHPMLKNFDAPDSLTACSRRARSTTPLQALNLLNDPVFWEAAEALGKRMAAAPDPLGFGFRAALGRDATAPERDKLASYHHARREKKGDAFAWTATASVLLNLDEFITRE